MKTTTEKLADALRDCAYKADTQSAIIAARVVLAEYDAALNSIPTVTDKGQANFPFIVERMLGTGNWGAHSGHKTEIGARTVALTRIESDSYKTDTRIVIYTGGPMQ